MFYHAQALFWALQGHREDVALVSFHKDEERETLIALVFSIRYFAGDRVFRSQQGIQHFQDCPKKGRCQTLFVCPGVKAPMCEGEIGCCCCCLFSFLPTLADTNYCTQCGTYCNCVLDQVADTCIRIYKKTRVSPIYCLSSPPPHNHHQSHQWD